MTLEVNRHVRCCFLRLHEHQKILRMDAKSMLAVMEFHRKFSILFFHRI